MLSRATGPERNAKAFAAAAMPARYALERGAWVEAAALQPRETGFPYTEAMTHFARAIGLAKTGRPQEGAAELQYFCRAKRKRAMQRCKHAEG